MKPEIKKQMDDLNEIIHQEVNKALQNILPEGKVAHVSQLRLVISDEDREGFVAGHVKTLAQTHPSNFHSAIPGDTLACTNPILLPDGQLICTH